MLKRWNGSQNCGTPRGDSIEKGTRRAQHDTTTDPMSTFCIQKRTVVCGEKFQVWLGLEPATDGNTNNKVTPIVVITYQSYPRGNQSWGARPANDACSSVKKPTVRQRANWLAGFGMFVIILCHWQGITSVRYMLAYTIDRQCTYWAVPGLNV
jgi:hypothetical protein